MPAPTTTTEAVTHKLCSLILKSALVARSRTRSLNDLPDDLILLVLEFAEVMDIIRLRQVRTGNIHIERGHIDLIVMSDIEAYVQIVETPMGMVYRHQTPHGGEAAHHPCTRLGR